MPTERPHATFYVSNSNVCSFTALRDMHVRTSQCNPFESLTWKMVNDVLTISLKIVVYELASSTCKCMQRLTLLGPAVCSRRHFVTYVRTDERTDIHTASSLNAVQLCRNWCNLSAKMRQAEKCSLSKLVSSKKLKMRNDLPRTCR